MWYACYSIRSSWYWCSSLMSIPGCCNVVAIVAYDKVRISLTSLIYLLNKKNKQQQIIKKHYFYLSQFFNNLIFVIKVNISTYKKDECFIKVKKNIHKDSFSHIENRWYPYIVNIYISKSLSVKTNKVLRFLIVFLAWELLIWTLKTEQYQHNTRYWDIITTYLINKSITETKTMMININNDNPAM